MYGISPNISDNPADNAPHSNDIAHNPSNAPTSYFDLTLPQPSSPESTNDTPYISLHIHSDTPSDPSMITADDGPDGQTSRHWTSTIHNGK